MKVIISQLRKSSAESSLPLFKHESMLSEDYTEMAMVTAEPGYDLVAVYFVPSDVLQQGHEDYIRLMRRIRECEEAGCWPGAVDGEAELSLPTYAYSEASDDLSDLELVS